MDILGLIWRLVFWFYMGGIVLGMYLKDGMVTGVYASISVLIIFLWFRRVGFFDSRQ